MAVRQLEALNPQVHADLRVRAWQGQKPHFVQIVVSEFAMAATRCPIFVTKNQDTGEFYAGAMFGFSPGEDLASQADDGAGSFLPLDLERHGFYISDNDIAIDPQNPCFSETDGEPLFVDSQISDALRRKQRALTLLKQGVAETADFIAAMLAAKLMEPIDISLRFDDGETLDLEGLYTISLDALGELGDDAALKLFRSGHLQLAYCMTGSLKQVSVLAERRNRRLTQQA
jgi:hypothetical protein